jgi:hypothetical protein
MNTQKGSRILAPIVIRRNGRAVTSTLRPAEWTAGLLKADRSLENFQVPYRKSNPEPPYCVVVPQPTASPLAHVLAR